MPGDHVLLTGVFLPSLRGASFGGGRGGNAAAAGGGLLADTYLEVHSLQLLSKTDDVTKADLPTEEEVESLRGESHCTPSQ